MSSLKLSSLCPSGICPQRTGFFVSSGVWCLRSRVLVDPDLCFWPHYQGLPNLTPGPGVSPPSPPWPLPPQTRTLFVIFVLVVDVGPTLGQRPHCECLCPSSVLRRTRPEGGGWRVRERPPSRAIPCRDRDVVPSLPNVTSPLSSCRSCTHVQE